MKIIIISFALISGLSLSYYSINHGESLNGFILSLGVVLFQAVILYIAIELGINGQTEKERFIDELIIKAFDDLRSGIPSKVKDASETLRYIQIQRYPNLSFVGNYAKVRFDGTYWTSETNFEEFTK